MIKTKSTEDLIFEEEWIIKDGFVEVFNQKFPITHPYAIYCKLYKEETNPELKYQFLKKLHDFLWPEDILTWNYWTERRFRTYCQGYKFISWASGAGQGKSYDSAKLTLLEYGCSPKDTGVLVVSTTLESSTGRVYGFILDLLKKATKAGLPFPFKVLRGNVLKIYFDRDNYRHMISALAAPANKDASSVRNYIGRHPDRKLLLVLDEGPDLNPTIL